MTRKCARPTESPFLDNTTFPWYVEYLLHHFKMNLGNTTGNFTWEQQNPHGLHGQSPAPERHPIRRSTYKIDVAGFAKERHDLWCAIHSMNPHRVTNTQNGLKLDDGYSTAAGCWLATSFSRKRISPLSLVSRMNCVGTAVPNICVTEIWTRRHCKLSYYTLLYLFNFCAAKLVYPHPPPSSRPGPLQ